MAYCTAAWQMLEPSPTKLFGDAPKLTFLRAG